MAVALAALLAAGWLVQGPARSAKAQGPAASGYRIIPINPGAERDPKLRSDVLRILRDGDISGDGQFGEEEQKRLQAYYWGYSLPRWTLPEYRSELAGNPEQLEKTTRGLRVELQNELRNGRNEAAFAFVTDLVLKSMENLARPYPAGERVFHPATRINAMLMIGELGANPPAGFGDVPPPLSDALPVMFKHLQDPEQIDGVRVAALVGINRHADLGGIETPQARQAIVNAMVALMNSPQPPERSADGHAWMRSQAADILGKLGIAAAGVPQGLTAMVADAALPISVRCVPAEALGKLNYAGAAGLNPSQIVVALGRLAEAAIARELAEKIEDEEPPETPPDAEPGAVPGIMPGAAPGEEPPATAGEKKPELSRRRLKAVLTSVAQGLTGLRQVATGPHQEPYLRVSRPVAAILTDLDDRRIKDDELKPKIEENHRQLQAALGIGGEPAAPATPPEPAEPPEPTPPVET
jgi:hypothetical protein